MNFTWWFITGHPPELQYWVLKALNCPGFFFLGVVAVKNLQCVTLLVGDTVA